MYTFRFLFLIFFVLTSNIGSSKNTLTEDGGVLYKVHSYQIKQTKYVNNISYSILGRLTNEYDVPISGATIYWKQVNSEKGIFSNPISATSNVNEKNFVKTDQSGEFIINVLSPGFYQIFALTNNLDVSNVEFIEITNNSPKVFIDLMVNNSDGGVIPPPKSKPITQKKKPVYKEKIPSKKKDEPIEIDVSILSKVEIERKIQFMKEHGMKLKRIDKNILDKNKYIFVFAEAKDEEDAHCIVLKEDSLNEIATLSKIHKGYENVENIFTQSGWLVFFVKQSVN